jgi:hypothetical protein
VLVVGQLVGPQYGFLGFGRFPSKRNMVILIVLEQAWLVTEFWCANHTKIPYFDREIKYLDCVSGHQASAETE